MTKIYFDSTSDLHKRYPMYSSDESKQNSCNDKICKNHHKTYRKVGSMECSQGLLWRINKVAQLFFLAVLAIVIFPIVFECYRKLVAKLWTEATTGTQKLSFYVLMQKKAPSSLSKSLPSDTSPSKSSEQLPESPSSSDSESDSPLFTTPPSPTKLKKDPSGSRNDKNANHVEAPFSSAKRKLSFSEALGQEITPSKEPPKPPVLLSPPAIPPTRKPIPADAFKTPLRAQFEQTKPLHERPRLDPNLVGTPMFTPHPEFVKQVEAAGKKYTPKREFKEPSVKMELPSVIPKAPLAINPKTKEKILALLTKKSDEVAANFDIPDVIYTALLSIVEQLRDGTLNFHTDLIDEILETDLSKDGSLELLQDIEKELQQEIEV